MKLNDWRGLVRCVVLFMNNVDGELLKPSLDESFAPNRTEIWLDGRL